LRAGPYGAHNRASFIRTIVIAMRQLDTPLVDFALPMNQSGWLCSRVILP
jgi:hypothetical protein